MQLFDTTKYQEVTYKPDWDNIKYDPAWDEPDYVSEIPQNKVSATAEHTTTVEVLEGEGEEVYQATFSDRWNPEHFGEVPRKTDENGNPTIFWDESIEPPLPDDFESLLEYEEAWQHWEKENSDSSTCVAGLGLVSPSQESSPEKSNYADCAKSTRFVKKDCFLDSPVSPSTKTLENSQEFKESTALQHRHHVNRLPLKENAWVEQIHETAFPQYYKLSEQSNPNSFVLKTSPDCCRHPNDQEKNPEHIFNRCSGSFMNSGTMHNGLLLERHLTLEPDGLVKGSYSLPRPGALSWSGNGRPPGTTFSVAKAKKLGLIGKNEVFNPEWLEQEFGLPIRWTSPQEHRAATELLERVEQPLETLLTPGSVKSSGGEYSTSTHSSKNGNKKSSDCWYTPPHIVELVVQVLRKIDLDPCSDDGKHIRATLHYTATDDGLTKEWGGHVFMNPPYSQPGAWMKKLQVEIESGRVSEAIALVPNATDTKWLSPFLKTQVVCFWTGRIKFLGEDYQPKNAARQSHIFVYWGENWKWFRDVFEPHGVVYLPLQPLNGDELDKFLLGDKEDNSPSKIELSPELNSPSNLLGDKEENSLSNSLSNLLGDKQKNSLSKIELSPELDSLSNLLGDKEENSPSKNIYPELKRQRGEGNGYIHWRTITKNGKEYSQAYYHWKEGNKKRSKYIPKKLLDSVKEADSTKRPVIEILELLDAESSPSNNGIYADIKGGSPSKLLGDKQINDDETDILQGVEDSPSNLDSSPSKIELSPSKRRKGDGSGNIHWRIITKGGKDYPQAYYHYELWKDGDRLVKSSKYIPKRLLSQVQRLESEKAPVKEILKLLGVVE